MGGGAGAGTGFGRAGAGSDRGWDQQILMQKWVEGKDSAGQV